ncbi:MAG: N-acetylmuramoyl-L-alanine amidase [Kiritimatiellia bacterium]
MWNLSFLFYTLVLCGVPLLAPASGRILPDTAAPVLRPGMKPVPVKEFAKQYGFTQVKVEKDRILLKGKLHELELEKYSRRAVLNGAMLWLNDAMVIHDRLWVLSETDVNLSLKPLIVPSEVLQGRGHQVVVLDAGHGGTDSGALSSAGLREKAVALDITRRVRAELLSRGYKVLLTRHDDTFLELEERTRRAHNWKADVFVSIHANSGDGAARGTETFVLSLPGHRSTNQSPQSAVPSDVHPGNAYNQANMNLGFSLHHSLVTKAGLNDRGLRRARFAVLKDAPCPAALVEVGFLSNAEEAQNLSKTAHRVRLAHSIANGIDLYLRAVKKAAMNAQIQASERGGS